MKAQHVWAAAATMVGSETMGNDKPGRSARYSGYKAVGKTTQRILLALILLMVFAVPLHAQTYVAAGDDLEAAVAAASDGDVLVLEGDPQPVVNTIPVDKGITIRGYDVSPCENLPTERVIGGLPDTCFDSATTNLNNADFEAGDDGTWVYSDAVSALDPYSPPTVITTSGTPQEGSWHAMFDVDARGAQTELEYQNAIPTLPSPISEEVRWANSVTNLCDVMDLTTGSTYTLPVLPPTLIENFNAPVFPVTLISSHMHIWLHVLQWSGHPDDKIEVFINGTPTAVATGAELDAWQTAGVWSRWHIPLGPALPVANYDINIQVTTRTDIANPTLALIGAVNINDDLAPALPTDFDSVNLFDYTSNLGPVESYAKAIFDLGALSITLPAPIDTQVFVARAGGLGTPYLAANMRTDGTVTASDTVKLIFESQELADIPLTLLPSVPAPCARQFFTLPSHLMNIPGRPRIRVSLTNADATTRVLVDDFTLSYITKALEDTYPDLAAAANIIPNGGFEKGTFPFLIESPVATPANCPHISEVILPSTEVCNGGYAAEFKPNLNLLLWMRLPQSSGVNTDQIEVIVADDGGIESLIDTVDMSTTTVDGSTLADNWKIIAFPFAPPTPDFTIILRSSIATNTETPTMFLLGAMDIQSGPPVATALPSPSALRIADLVAADLTSANPLGGVPATAIPPMLFNAPPYAVSGHTHVLRFGGLGTTLKFNLKRLSGPGLGTSTLTVPISGGTDWTTDDGSMSTSCQLQVVTPDHFPTDANLDLSFVSSILPNPVEPTEFFVDDVCLSYLALETPAMDVLATTLGLAVPCDRNQLLEGGFEGTPSDEWTVLPAAIPFTDVVKSIESCSGSLPNTAAVFSGIETTIPVWDLTLEQTGITLPVVITTLELKFYLDTLRDGGASPGEFRIELDDGTPAVVFSRTSDSGASGYTEYSVDITAYQGLTVDMRLMATLPRSITPPAFAIDDIQICESGHLAGALFDVQPGGSLTLQSVTLDQAGAGVRITDGSLQFLQSMMRTLDGNGIEALGGDTFVASSVFHGNRDNAIHVAGGSVLVLQSTLRDNGSAGVLVDSGSAHVAASLLDTNGQGIVVNGGTARSYVNWVENNDNAAVNVAGFADLDATTISPDYLDAPWKGKLNIPLMPTPDEPTLSSLVSQVTSASGVSNTSGWNRDFDCDFRPSFEKAQIGSDQLDLTPVECPVDSLGADQQPHLPTDTWTAPSSNNAAYVAEYTPNVQLGSVSYITWWGIWLDGGGAPCTPSGAPEFEIATYDGPGGTETALELVQPSGTELTSYTYSGATLYKYEYAFGRDVLFRDQYLSIRAIVIPADDCWFHWMSSPDPASQDAAVDAAGNPININLSLCISEYSIGDDCTIGADLSHPPVYPSGPPLPATPSTDVLPVYKKLPLSGTLSVGLIEFWGIWLTNEATPMPCTAPDSPSLAITYIDDTSLGSGTVIPITGKLIVPDAEVAGPLFTTDNGDMVPMYRYTFVPDGVFNLDNGWWFSVHQTGAVDANCNFYWVESAQGVSARTWDGSTDNDLGVSVSLCMGLALPGATVSNCTVSPDPIGKDEPGTVTVEGTNLVNLDTVLLVPQLALPATPGNAGDPSLHLDLSTSSITESVSTNEDFTSLKIKFRLSDAFNTPASGGPDICTDGRATFVSVVSGVPTPGTSQTPGEDDTLIDTIEPKIVPLNYDDVGPVTPMYCNAASGSPSISANRVPPPFTLPSWAPSFPGIIPKNNRLDLDAGEVHVYLNEGSVFNDTYENAESSGPTTDLNVIVQAFFIDTEPVDLSDNTYPVEISGFINTTLPSTAMSPYDYPTGYERGTAHWAGSPVAYYGANATFTGTGTNLSANWDVFFPFPGEPGRISFKLEAIDLAGNEGTTTALGNDYGITLHWLFRTKAKFQNPDSIDMNLENPEIYWRLDRSFSDLPDAKPECAPPGAFQAFLF